MKEKQHLKQNAPGIECVQERVIEIIPWEFYAYRGLAERRGLGVRLFTSQAILGGFIEPQDYTSTTCIEVTD
ncbi:hypothetical protein SAMN05443507_1205 [Alicyclobacillus tolerans]|uniref:Uncharacterized protein n=1 Tax=Alicyclobacillus tolerans TaxID=90970 RepID=A0A1M6UJJ2_9BACL|nr:hypothetical protein SAMN05443507_1205 [Alicyclobacillus montanus]